MNLFYWNGIINQLRQIYNTNDGVGLELLMCNALFFNTEPDNEKIKTILNNLRTAAYRRNEK